MELQKETYAKARTWDDFFDKEGELSKVRIHPSWKDMFTNHIFNDKRFEKIQSKLKEVVKEGEGHTLYPLPEYLFNAFVNVPMSSVKVVFIGQDPYFNCERSKKGKIVPQATGLSFSVPQGVTIPSSLNNIYNNLENNNHFRFRPKHGCLDFWANQGCLMLNAALTVKDGQKNSHATDWKWATDRIIKYVSDNCDYVIFVLWGGDALKKTILIDQDKHDVIISSHPSGLSAHKPLRSYPAFNDFDHFGEINKLLKKHDKKRIIWQV